MAAKSIGVVLPADSASIQKQLLEVSDPQVSIDFLYELIKTRFVPLNYAWESPFLYIASKQVFYSIELARKPRAY